MGSFLLLIIPILIAMSVSDYLNAKSDLENAYKLLQNQTESNILNAVKLVDAGHQVLEKSLGKEMRKAFTVFLNAYETSGKNPAKMNLQALKKQFDDKMDLYIINANGIVEYTTYTKDLGLDFKAIPDFFPIIKKYLEKGEFVNRRLASEMRTGSLRQFSYMPTPDRKYLFELGIEFNDFAEQIGELALLKISERLRTLNPSLNTAKFFDRYGRLLGNTEQKIDPETKKTVIEVFNTKKSQEIQDTVKKRYIRYIFVNLKDENDSGDDDSSKVIELTYNTKLIDEGLQRTASFHFVISIAAIILSIIVTFIISAWITHPIQRLVESVDIIAKGNLEYPVEVETNNELKLLKQSIAKMVENMLLYINKIKHQNIELKELDKLKDDFLSNTSHELRTPINGIIGIADSLIDGAAGALPKLAIDNLSMIVLSGRRLANLVNDILDFSKLKHKNIELQIKPIEIKVVTDVVLTLSKPLIDKKDIILINKIMDEPPVDADENRVQQILHNLIGNAIKFTEVGTVTVSSVTEEGYLQIIVSDTGIGISPEKIHKVFTPFEQADGSISRDYGGTGLGLSITKQLVELHGGGIHIESTVGQGTQVSFTLPLSKDQAVERTQDAISMLTRIRDSQPIEISVEDYAEIAESSVEILPEKAMLNRESFEILIVDDDPVNLQVLENLLRLENYRITRAFNGKEALDAINSGTPFVIVLLDIMMPKMSGFEVCRIIRETHGVNQLPIIMLTAKNQVSDLVEGLQAGANDYLTKPFSKGELITRIKTHIQLSRINVAYSNFVPLEFLKLLEKESIVDVRLGDHVQKRMAILFADIRSFTTLSESMTPKENFDFINAYLGRVSPVIRKHNGFIDKYIGDAIMALFPATADDAVQAAIEIHHQLVLFNQERQEKNLQPIKIGIGIHTGTLMLGTIGEEKRMEGTVISDAVNLASRLEGLTKLYGAALIISGDVLTEIVDVSRYRYRFLGKVRVMGKQEAAHIFEVIDAEADEEIRHQKIVLEPAFEQAIDMYYQRRFKQAITQFQYLLDQLPQDKAASFFLERCQYYLEHDVPSNWEGIEMLAEK
ncbi:MAG: hypothetical protein BWK79_10815 [Beggiatoa sp. IS2]|nr:MAG: hypothetical protein BWK79_10815 [Beggiatoa sp. IS2]